MKNWEDEEAHVTKREMKWENEKANMKKLKDKFPVSFKMTLSTN